MPEDLKAERDAILAGIRATSEAASKSRRETKELAENARAAVSESFELLARINAQLERTGPR